MLLFDSKKNHTTEDFLVNNFLEVFFSRHDFSSEGFPTLTSK